MKDQRIWFAHNINGAGDTTVKDAVIAKWKTSEVEHEVIGVMRNSAEIIGKVPTDQKSIRAKVEDEIIPGLKEFCEANGVADCELAVVTHSTILSNMSAGKWDENDKPVGPKSFKNCEVSPHEL